MTLQIRRGTDADRLTITPESGELIYTTDTKDLYVGDGTTVGGTIIGGGGGGGTGATGISGFSGFSGYSGRSGYSGAVGATGVGGSITVKDEGSTLTTAATSLDFVGAGVTATNVGGAVTVTIPGGGGGGATGVSGFSGYSGAAGSPGGATGATGFGATGATGFSGYSGVVGATGFGATGFSGYSGVIGAAGDRYATTSSTSLTIASSGTITLTVGTGLAYTAAQSVIIANNGSNYMSGTVNSYNSGTGVMTVILTASTGSGTYSSWSVNLAGAVGAVGATGLTGATGLSITGATGLTGMKYATAYLYQWAPTQPSNPTGNSTWTWSSASNGSYTAADGWDVLVPANPGGPTIKLWVAAKTFSAASDAVTTSISWTGTSSNAYSANGAIGATGLTGLQTATPTLYKWDLGPAPTITNPSPANCYFWSTGVINNTLPSGWCDAITTSPSSGYTLWAASVTLQDSSTATYSCIDWTGALRKSVGYAGNNGATGPNGSSSRIAYARIAGSPTPLSATVTTSGGSSYPDATSIGGVWGSVFNVTWTAGDPNPSSTDSLFQVYGIYNGTNTVWDTPFLASLRVGQLSAITTNTGTLTVNSGGYMCVGTGGYIKVGNNPQISGSTMTGSGGVINGSTNGEFALGNSTANLSFDGTTLTVNGNLIATGNINSNAVTNNANAYSLNYIDTGYWADGGATIVWEPVQNLSIPTSGSTVYVTYTNSTTPGCAAYSGNCIATCPIFRIKVNGSPVYTTTATALSYSHTPGAGTQCYIIEATQYPATGNYIYSITCNAQVSSRSLFALEMKR